MELKELAEAVKNMRKAQNAYFRNRTRENLETSKILEREVDNTVKKILDVKPPEVEIKNQSKLF